DAKRAIAWLKVNAAHMGVNPDRIVVSGGSAGGHLALMAAYTPNSPDFDPEDVRAVDTTVRGVFVYYPVPDLRTLKDAWSEQSMHPLAHALGRSLGYFSKEGYLRWTALAERLFGGPLDEIGDLLLAYSPVAHVGGHCPPTLILQGQHDHVVPLADVRALTQSLVAAGRQVVLVELPQVEHAFDMFALQVSPPAQSALYDVERFLALMV
ncbi:MAG: alpha/beta hydrolase, partial [Anaerolineae bacterium]|nr:alpha/beta hydrolase [Anaerolineae bacterium]